MHMHSRAYELLRGMNTCCGRVASCLRVAPQRPPRHGRRSRLSCESRVRFVGAGLLFLTLLPARTDDIGSSRAPLPFRCACWCPHRFAAAHDFDPHLHVGVPLAPTSHRGCYACFAHVRCLPFSDAAALTTAHVRPHHPFLAHGLCSRMWTLSAAGTLVHSCGFSVDVVLLPAMWDDFFASAVAEAALPSIRTTHCSLMAPDPLSHGTS